MDIFFNNTHSPLNIHSIKNYVWGVFFSPFNQEEIIIFYLPVPSS